MPRVRRALFILSSVVGLAGGFLLLLKASDLEAESINVGTVLGRADPEPTVDLLWAGLAVVALAVALALVGLALPRRRR